MARAPAFQAGYAGSIPVTRSRRRPRSEDPGLSSFRTFVRGRPLSIRRTPRPPSSSATPPSSPSPTSPANPEILDDHRLAAVAPYESATYLDDLAAGRGYGEHHAKNLRRLVTVERQHRNTDTGYWIAETDPDAADLALVRSWPRASVRAVLVATDGVNRYQQPAS
jgi:hypothetical protein